MKLERRELSPRIQERTRVYRARARAGRAQLEHEVRVGRSEVAENRAGEHVGADAQRP